MVKMMRLRQAQSDKINEITQQNASLFQSLNDDANNLSNQADNLNEVIGFFKI